MVSSVRLFEDGALVSGVALELVLICRPALAGVQSLEVIREPEVTFLEGVVLDGDHPLLVILEVVFLRKLILVIVVGR